MSHLRKETIKKLAELSHIRCTDQEEESLLGDLENILGYFDQLDDIDTDGVPACNHVLSSMSNVMREDVVGETMPRETFLSNAPEKTSDGLVRVPPIITKTSQRDGEE